MKIRFDPKINLKDIKYIGINHQNFSRAAFW